MTIMPKVGERASVVVRQVGESPEHQPSAFAQNHMTSDAYTPTDNHKGIENPEFILKQPLIHVGVEEDQM